MNQNNKFQIAVDGTAASGKSTICKLIAKEFNFVFVTTGGFYRSIAYFLNQKGLVEAKQDAIIQELNQHQIEVNQDLFYIDKVDVSKQLKQNEISLIASNIATRPYIRDYVNQILLNLVNTNPFIIMDGRGIVDEIMPNADLQFYFYCSIASRAKRRVEEIRKLGNKASFLKIYWDLLKRDYFDKHRKIAPSKKNAQMVLIKTSNKTINQVFEETKKYIKDKIC
ncbi:MAG: (d)CMP kinase [Malacoplasma sp.]|nr:(d)CMP kinase [Malacoplasma sp.]